MSVNVSKCMNVSQSLHKESESDQPHLSYCAQYDGQMDKEKL